jgi:hypothetical protein
MTSRNVLCFSRAPGAHNPAWAGWRCLIDRATEVARASDLAVMEASGLPRIASGDRFFSLTFEHDPESTYGLVARHAHHGPFWQIDRALAPWDLEVARRRFIAGSVDGEAAEVFYHFWRDKLFGDAPYRATCDGFALIDLRGALSRKGPGQLCSPLKMIEHALQYEPDRPLVVSLAPDAAYSEADLAPLHRLDDLHARLTVRIGDMKNLLRTCDYVVTQNGTVALDSYFFGKTPVLFGRIDTHHIGLDVRRGMAESFETASQHKPDFARYVLWFLQDQAINVQEHDASVRIAQRLSALGWPVQAPSS